MIRYLTVVLLLFAPAALAQDRRPSHCIALANSAPGLTYLHKAAYDDQVEKDSVRITYVTHSTFLLRTAGGLGVATDFTGYLGETDYLPDVVTMNHAHSSHWTARPDPRIGHVLKGWGDGRTPADHHLDLGEILIRNVPTDIRSSYQLDNVETGGNSIFVFEVAGLCIGHLGHLHHEPDAGQYAALGRLDIVMAAVDGGMTVELPVMIQILTRLRSAVVIPMHWQGSFSLDRFVAGMPDTFDVQRPGASSATFSLRNLPRRPTILVLEQGFAVEREF
ncbi:MAG: MBL fold metallo-hydrolase [Pseudoruegeria sp.]